MTTKDKILSAAIALFSHKGFNGTTTKEIASKACVNEALIFRHFSTKKELYGSIIEKITSDDPVGNSLFDNYKNINDDGFFFTSLANWMFDKSRKDRAFIRLLYFSALEGHELSNMFLDNYIFNLRKVISEYIEIRISDGAFKKVNSLLAARAFLGMVGNYIISQEIFGEKKNEKVDKAAIKTFVRIYIDGLNK